MNIAIIEDEAKTLESIQLIIEQYIADATIIGTASTAEKAYECLSNNNIDLALCDINIGEKTIFDVLSKFDTIPFKLIFITAHEKYAIKAIKLSAIDYIVKPLDPLELIAAIKKARESMNQSQEKLKAKALVDNMKNEKQEHLILKTAENIFLVHTNEIIYIEADGSYSTFHLTRDRKIVVSKILKEYEEILDKEQFARTHQSFLVNLFEIERFDKTDGGFLVMKNGAHVPVSQRKREDVLTRLEKL